jgi:quercetin dioxygenase-like cupin family protein
MGHNTMTTTTKIQGRILRPSEIKPHERGGGARTIPLVTRTIGSTSMLNGITEFGPGAAIPLHTHNCEESVMVLDGEAIAELDGVQHRMAATDTTWVPANVPHRFINASDSNGLRIFWTYASVDATRTIVATGETRSVDSERT